MLQLGKIPWEVAAWENTLESCSLGKYPRELQLGKIPLGVAAWENTLRKLQLGKIPLGSCSFGKYPWEVAACHLIYIYGPFKACSKQKREEPRVYSGDDYIVGGNDALPNSYPWYVIDMLNQLCSTRLSNIFQTFNPIFKQFDFFTTHGGRI